MPLLDIATSQPSFRNHFCTSRLQTLLRGTTPVKLTFRKEKRLPYAWEGSTKIPRKVNFDVGHLKMRGALLIKSVATLDPNYLVQSEGHMNDLTSSLVPDSNPQVSLYPSEDSAEMNEREKLRRKRISKANRGNVPWNKGRKHSPETLQRIRERTRLAMQNPKVKEKLMNLGHAQSEETKIKIGEGVRIGWQRRRKKLVVQETCLFEWENLIAEASRKGYAGQQELHWYSYEVLDEQLEQEWSEIIEKRKLNPMGKGNRRAPKSPEQRKKISDAIAAKWADPDYRERVREAMFRFHGSEIGAERKPRRIRRPREDSQSTRSPAKKKASETADSPANQAPPRLKKKHPVPYRDPLVDTKFEMIRNIRAEREATESKKIEATERAKLLIAEAEKAAKALEVAAMKSPVALAALMETRKLIAEATRSIQAVKIGDVTPPMVSKNDSQPSLESFNEQVNHHDDEEGQEAVTENGGLSSPDKEEINGTHILSLSNNETSDFDFSKFTLQRLLNSEEPVDIYSKDHLPTAQIEPNSLINVQLDPHYHEQMGPPPLEPNGVIRHQKITEVNGTEETQVVQHREKTETSSTDNTTKKKWIRGRLVEVTEDD